MTSLSLKKNAGIDNGGSPKNEISLELVQRERVGATDSWCNAVILGDNLRVLDSSWLAGEVAKAGGLKLIYIDPPFDVGMDFKMKVEVCEDKQGKSAVFWEEVAYRDKWGKKGGSYLDMMRERLERMHALLSEDGWLFLHCDWRTNAHLRLILDDIFGSDNFRNEIIWSYRSGGATQNRFARKHDTIFLYSKSKASRFFPLREKSYNRGLKPYRFKGVTEYEDEHGWYTMVSMRDVWEIDMVGRTSSERVSYPTQKPIKLLQRIIESTTQPGDLVMDLFCGSGTTLAVAEQLDRRWFGVDSSARAVHTTWKRLLEQGQKAGAFCAAKIETKLDRFALRKRMESFLSVAGAVILRDQYFFAELEGIPVYLSLEIMKATDLEQLIGTLQSTGRSEGLVVASRFEHDCKKCLDSCSDVKLDLRVVRIKPVDKSLLLDRWHTGEYQRIKKADTITYSLRSFFQPGEELFPDLGCPENGAFLKGGVICRVHKKKGAEVLTSDWCSSIDYWYLESAKASSIEYRLRRKGRLDTEIVTDSSGEASRVWVVDTFGRHWQVAAVESSSK